MHRLTIRRVLLGLAFLGLLAGPARAQDPWMVLPPTPVLPALQASGHVTVHDAVIWYGVLGKPKAPWVVLLHGGLANSAYMGALAADLAPHYHVLLIDSRGQGRSSAGSDPIGYELMAGDVLGVMDHLTIDRAYLVGWSDGAIIGLELARRHPERLAGLFAFAANSDPSGVADVNASPVFTEYEKRAAAEYAVISPTPLNYVPVHNAITEMWNTQPHFAYNDLAAIRVPTWIVDADHDEAILRSNTDAMAAAIPHAREMILPGVSHFAFLQDPATFYFAVETFLRSP